MSDEEALALADPDAPDRHMFWNEKWFSNQACCEEYAQAQKLGWGMGSHYHCPRCWKESSMLGHHVGVHVVGGKLVRVEFHQCCPDWCELSGEPDPAQVSAHVPVRIVEPPVSQGQDQ